LQVALDFFEHSPCAQVRLDMDGCVRFANQSFWTLCGIDDRAGAKFHFQQSLTKGAAMFYESQLVPTLLQRGRVEGISLELRLPSGQQIPVFVNAVLRRGTDGRPAGMFLAIFDATQRRLYEKELLRARKDAEHLSEVVRRSSDAILRLSQDGTIQSWNDGAKRIFDWSPQEVVGRYIALLIHEDAMTEMHDAISLLSCGIQVTKDLTGVRRDGSTLALSVSLTPHLEAPGTLVAFSAIIRDVTSQKVSERALLQNEKLASVGRMASSIAHEINNPLEAVTNLLYILQSHPLAPESLNLVTMAQEELARVSQITTQTLRFYKQSSRRAPVDVEALVQSVFALYRARLANAGITATNDSKRASPLLCFDGELRQIIVNLVANAYDAMKSGGTLTIRCRDTMLFSNGHSELRITVADTGTGMDAPTLRRLFEPFFTTKGIGGTGLGLWITQNLVKKNQGRICVRSSIKPGKRGTVFALTFPHECMYEEA
jgi:PAS domain S-box-containing protein